MNAKNNRVVSLCCLTISCLVLSACSEKPVPEERLRPVKSITVKSGVGAIRDRAFSGTAQSSQEADLSFKVSGTVERIAVEVGDKVKRGDLIAELDKETYQLQLEQARAAVAQTNATRRSAEAEYQRIRQLYTNDNASRNELDNALASTESAKASHSANVQSERLAVLNLDYTQLKVDADCSVAALEIEVNENISAGQTVAQVSCGENWEVTIDVPESLIAAFQDGMPGIAQFSSLPGKSFTGEVTEVGVGTRGSATFPVTLALNEVPPNIRSNLAAEVVFQFTEQVLNQDQLYVPPAAVVQDENGTFVYVMEASDRAGAAILKRRGVEVGEVSALGLAILNGLSDGERIVTAGQVNARDGLLVRDE